MRRRTLLASALAAVLPGVVRAAVTEGVEEALRRETALAGAESKALLVFFHASWCSWCRVFDRLLADPPAASVFNKHFRVFHVRAQEHTEANRALELPGAETLYSRYAPDGAGLPFYLVVDARERPVVTSISARTGENIGFPVAAPELDAFAAVLKTGAPAITALELKIVRDACVRMMARR